MSAEEYLDGLGIKEKGTFSEQGAYVIDLKDSNHYGKIYSKLEKSEDLYPLEDNQVITVQGSSLIYVSESKGHMLNLIADFDNDRYQLIVNEI